MHASRAYRSSGAHHGSRSVSAWCRASLLEASSALQQGAVSSVELTQACIEQIEATTKLNMFVYTDNDRALQLAKESDARRASGRTRGALDGIPIGVKDIFCMENVPTTASSKILEGASALIACWCVCPCLMSSSCASQASCLLTNPLQLRDCSRAERFHWESSTWTNSPWDRQRFTPRLGRQ